MKKELYAPATGRPLRPPAQKQENFSQAGIRLTSDPNRAYVRVPGLGIAGEAPTFRRNW